MLHPLVHHGIALEAHAQNTVVRLCTATGKIKGFAIRDFGGVHFHKSTLREQGFPLDWEISGSLTLTDDLISVWHLASHTLLQCHAPSLLYGLRLETHGGWGVVMEELESVLQGFGGDVAKELLEYFCVKTVVLKSFLRMLMAGMYREVSFFFAFLWVLDGLMIGLYRILSLGFLIRLFYRQHSLLPA
jgi:siderophore synthetase component